MEYFELENGAKIPKIGFGTYKAVSEEVVVKALQAGYRHLDTAWIYGNQREVGNAVKKSGLEREDVYLTSKVFQDHLSYEKAMESFQETITDLQTDYVDLLLIHWPRRFVQDTDWQQADIDTWRALEELYAKGKVHAIGVSNFLPHHLMPLLKEAKIKPMVNQIECHPGYPQKITVDFCHEKGMLVEGWSPLGRTRMFSEPLLVELAEKYHKSVAQICIRFSLQCGVLPLPKASSTERMLENQDVFDFAIEESDFYRLLELPQIGWSGEHPDRERDYGVKK